MTDCKKNPSRILIGHPFNPPHLVPLVEVVPHQGTGSNHVEKALEFYKDIGKEPVLVKSETPGFIANRLQAAVCREAYSLVSRGIVSAKDLGMCTVLVFMSNTDVPRQNNDFRPRPTLGNYGADYD